VVLAGVTGAAPALGQECAGMVDGNRSVQIPVGRFREGPVCREAPAQSAPGRLDLATVLNPTPAPAAICTGETKEDGKAIGGDAGGSCGIYLACPSPPYEHVGTCFCKRAVASSAE